MEQKDIRAPIVSVLGHVDHGKSSILDAIRGTSITSKEAGAITQSIGASFVPIKVVEKLCEPIRHIIPVKFKIPGLLFIDTPGHAAFTTLRKRGGSIADMAILVIDVNEGIKPQTSEAIELLKTFKTPFIIALNKIDRINGYKKKHDLVMKDLNEQDEFVQQQFYEKAYKIIADLYEKHGIEADLFDRVDFTKKFAVVPTSAVNGLGIRELLLLIAGLSQKYLEDNLKLHLGGLARGVVLEVREFKGLGKTLDVILYDGTLHVGDKIVLGTLDGDVLVTKVRALLLPKDLEEIRDEKAKFDYVKEVKAAIGVKIWAQDIENAVAGMPLYGLDEKEQSLEKIKEEIKSELQSVIIESDSKGVVLKADSLGSLEALINIFRGKEIPIRAASLGNISKKDIMEAETQAEENPEYAVVIGFNVKVDSAYHSSKVKIITDKVIYNLLDKYEEYLKELKEKLLMQEFSNLNKPFKFKILKNHIFRQSNPAIVGIEVLAGTLVNGKPVMKDGREISYVKSIQLNKENLKEAKKGMQVAISLPGVIAGRQIKEEDILYSYIPEPQFRKLKELKKYLSVEEQDLLDEIQQIMRKQNPMWGFG